MKTAIYCFSGTGNSLRVAHVLAQALDATVLSMVRALEGPLDESFARVVLVFPTYMYRPPRLAVRFFAKLPKGSHVIAVTTHGGDPADVLQATRTLLAQGGVTLEAGFAVKMPGNYTPFGGPGRKNEVEALLAEADLAAKTVGERILAGAREVGGPWGGFFGRNVYPGLWYKLGYWAIPRSAKSFSTNEACVGCGSCAKVCPVDNIVMVDGRPRWNERCEQCFGCVQWCAKQAIEMGRATVGVERYHHPRVTRREMIDFHGRRNPA